MFNSIKKQIAKLSPRELAEWRRYYPKEVVRQVALESSTEATLLSKVKWQVVSDYWLSKVSCKLHS